MKESRDYLEEALTKLGDKPDVEKARTLKFSPQALSLYRNGTRKMDDFACIMVARVLEIDPMKIIASCQEEREKNPERREFWRDFQKTLGAWVVAALVSAMMTLTPSQANAKTVPVAQSGYDIVFIMSNLRRRFVRYYTSSARFFMKFVQIFCLCHLQHIRQ